MVEILPKQPKTTITNQQYVLRFSLDYQKDIAVLWWMYTVCMRILLADAARHELSKVISARDNYHWLSMSYEGVLSQLWQNRDFCDKNCDKTVAKNCSNCDKNLNFSGWKKKMALSQSSEMCRDKVIFSFSKTRLFYLETFQVHSLFPAFKS